MSSKTQDWSKVAEALEALRAEVASLGKRVAALEGGPAEATAPVLVPTAAAQTPAAEAPAAKSPAPAAAAAIGEEVLLVIGAALAAFFGKRPHIRQIRLLSGAAWAQEGRITIQASHARVRKG